LVSISVLVAEFGLRISTVNCVLGDGLAIKQVELAMKIEKTTGARLREEVRLRTRIHQGIAGVTRR
jgi:hypothetical protein